MSPFRDELENCKTLADCCNAYQSEFIRIQKTQGWPAALSAKYSLRHKAADMYIKLYPEVMYEYITLEEVMQLIV